MARVRPRITQPQAYGLFRPIPRIVALPPIHTPHFRRLTVLASVRPHPLDRDSSPGDVHRRQQRSRWVVDRRPIYNPTRVGWVHGDLSGERDKTYRQLVVIPIHFRKLTLTWRREEDLPLTTTLMEDCSCALEPLDIAHDVRCTSIQHRSTFRRRRNSRMWLFRWNHRALMDHRGTPNHHTRTSRPPTNLNLRVFRFRRHRGRRQHWAGR